MIYWRLFLVMLVSWVLFIFFDALRPHVVTIMNGLHLIALVSLLNAAMQSPSALIQRLVIATYCFLFYEFIFYFQCKDDGITTTE